MLYPDGNLNVSVCLLPSFLIYVSLKRLIIYGTSIVMFMLNTCSTMLPSSAQALAKLGWVSLSFDSSSTRPPHILRHHHHISCAATIQTSSEIAENWLNLLCNICRYTPLELKTILSILKRWKTTSREEELNGRWPLITGIFVKWETTWKLTLLFAEFD